jgi:acyl carrier protein phosphodiesterase
MNFLGHLYFSHNECELMIANLFGDHFHGNQYTALPKPIQKGIILHRQIDSYTDTHPAVKSLRLSLYKELPKVAGIAIDLYFDHLLAANWTLFHDKPYVNYLDEFYDFNSAYEVYYPQKFLHFMEQLKTNKWMNHYGTAHGLQKSCEGVASRLSFANTLPTAPDVFYHNITEIESTFHQFMKDARAHFLMS